MRSEWIDFVDAVQPLAQRFYDYVAQDWMAGYRTGWDTLRASLESSELRSKIGDRGSFEFQLLASDGSIEREINLEPDGTIPAAFWIHHREAETAYSDGLITLQDEPGSHQAGSDFWFRNDRGIIDGKTLRGRAERVLVEARGLPKGAMQVPKRRGRKPGTKKFDYSMLGAKGAAMSRALGISRKEAARILFPEAPRRASDEATFDELYRAILRAAN